MHKVFNFDTVKALSGNHLVLQQSTLAVELSSKVLSSPCSICWLLNPIRLLRSDKLSTGKTFPMLPTCLLRSWSSWSLSTSKGSVLCYPWGQRVLVANRVLTRSSCSTPPTCRSFSNLLSSQTSTSSLRYFLLLFPHKGLLAKKLYLIQVASSPCETASIQEVQWKFLCEPIGTVERVRVQWTIYTS